MEYKNSEPKRTPYELITNGVGAGDVHKLIDIDAYILKKYGIYGSVKKLFDDIYDYRVQLPASGVHLLVDMKEHIKKEYGIFCRIEKIDLNRLIERNGFVAVQQE